MEEELKQNRQEEIELSRKIQAFKLSDNYVLFASKLASDYKRLVNDLIEKENPEIRGAIMYITALKDWFDSRSELEELINLEKRKIDDDNSF